MIISVDIDGLDWCLPMREVARTASDAGLPHRPGLKPAPTDGRHPSSRAGLALDLEPLVEISPDRFHQRLDLAVKKMIGARDNLLLDDNAFLGLELVDERADVLVRYHRVLVAMNDHAG